MLDSKKISEVYPEFANVVGEMVTAENTLPILEMETSKKSRMVTFLLSAFFGGLGVHRFYVGKTATGIVMLVLTLSFIGIIVTAVWALIDFIMIISGIFKDKDGKVISDWQLK
jgi:TM2 domain-containing membrane protein YozV